MQTLTNFIDGAWRPSRGALAPDVNPADTSDVVAQAPSSPSEDADAAAQAAARAFEGWRATPAPVRGQLLYRVHRKMEERKEEIALALTREEGKTLSDSRGEVQRAINVIEFFAGEGRRISGETLPSELPDNFVYTIKQPIGPIALISPWNFPIAIPIWKMAPAIVSGNTVVLKPASLTPLTASLIADVFHQCGAPPGVVNVVYGSGGAVGETLLNHPAIKAVSFTGSNDVGNRVYHTSASRGIKCQCEMGGKNPVVVLEDADLELAAAGTMGGAFGSTGQRCTATSRAIVVDAIAREFTERLEAKARAIKVGPGTDPSTTMGPVVDQSQLDTVLSYIEIGKQEGARIVTGGGRATGDGLDRGFFVTPTIFDQVTPDMRLAQEEIFGPVLSVIRAPDAETALAYANQVRFGLSASVYTRDVSAAFKFVDLLEAGIIHVNSPTVGGEAHIPFGGTKATGVGLREMGRVAIDFYTELKSVYVDYTGSARTSKLY